MDIKKRVKKVQTNTANNNTNVITGFRKTLNKTDRKSRGKSQRIFLVVTHEHDDCILERKYDVMGTTGNIYTVTIKTAPTCTCPDHISRYKRCKHIYFVLTCIMKVQQDQEDIQEYNDNDLNSMFLNIPEITNNLKVNKNLVNKYKSLKKNGNGEVKQKDIDEDDQCPVCLDNLCDCDEELVYCKYYCGNSVHKECFEIINKKKDNITCLYCTKAWSKTAITASQYINLS